MWFCVVLSRSILCKSDLCGSAGFVLFGSEWIYSEWFCRVCFIPIWSVCFCSVCFLWIWPVGFVLDVSVLCVFFSTMESSIPNVPRSLESIKIPSPAWREFNHDESQSEPECRSFFFFSFFGWLFRWGVSIGRGREREQKVKKHSNTSHSNKAGKSPSASRESWLAEK